MISDLGNSFDERDELARQTLARAISLEIIEQIEPSQVEPSDLVIDDLIDLAEQGRVVPRGVEAAFGFGGLDLIAQFVVPAVVAALTTLIVRRHAADKPADHDQSIDRTFLTEQQLADIVQRADFTATSRQVQEMTRLINTLINRYFEAGGAASYVPGQVDIDNQRKRLELHRQRLRFYLDQKAIVGIPQMTPASDYEIQQARAEIRRIKDILRSWGVAVDDHPDDELAA